MLQVAADSYLTASLLPRFSSPSFRVPTSIVFGALINYPGATPCRYPLSLLLFLLASTSNESSKDSSCARALWSLKFSIGWQSVWSISPSSTAIDCIDFSFFLFIQRVLLIPCGNIIWKFTAESCLQTVSSPLFYTSIERSARIDAVFSTRVTPLRCFNRTIARIRKGICNQMCSTPVIPTISSRVLSIRIRLNP